ELEPLDPPGGRWMLTSTIKAVRSAEFQQIGTMWWSSGQSPRLLSSSSAWLDPNVFLPLGDTTFRLGERAIFGSAVFAVVASALLLLVTRIPSAMQLCVKALGGSQRIHSAEHLEQALLIWTSAGACITALSLAWQPSVLSASALLAAGVLAILARSSDSGVSTARGVGAVVALPVMIHAVAHSEATARGIATGFMGIIPTALVPLWAGPALGVLALVVTLGGVVASNRSKDGRNASLLLQTQLVALAYAVLALQYGAATGGTMQSATSFPRILDLAQQASDGRFAGTFSVAETLGALTITSAIAAWSWRGAL